MLRYLSCGPIRNYTAEVRKHGIHKMRKSYNGRGEENRDKITSFITSAGL